MRVPWATVTYTVVLLSTTAVQHLVTSSTRHHLIIGSSTDIAHLSRDPALVLLASAFWLPDATSLVFAPLVVALLAKAEFRFGAARVVATFVIGHVLATLLTEGTVWIGVGAGWLGASHEHRLDVGPSYGAAAVLGLFVAALSTRHRILGFAGLTAFFGVPLIVDSELTTIGHLLAVAVGFALWRVPWFKRAQQPPDARGGQAVLPPLTASPRCQ